MQLTVNETLRGFLENQAAMRGYGSASEYVEALLANLQFRIENKKELEAMLLEGVRSPKVVADDAFWEERRRKVLERDPEFKP